MSQWTHPMGTVRFDSFNNNVYPPPPNKKRIIQAELEQIQSSFQETKLLPAGSEGPVEYKIFLTDRGTTVLVIGDLRDYGKDDLMDFPRWLNDVYAIYKLKKPYGIPLIVRDCFIRLEVEFCDDLYFVTYDLEQQFCLYKVNQKPIQITD